MISPSSPRQGRNGEGARPGGAVILGHGMWSDARVFGPMIRHMTSRARILALDFPGHGARKDEPPAGSFEVLAKEFLEAVPERGPPALLVGISMGAIAALHAALLDPGAVGGLVLFAGSGAAEPPHRRLLYRALAGAYRAMGPVAPLRWGVERVAFSPGWNRSEARNRLVRRARALPRETVSAALWLMADRPAVQDRLHEIDVPVAVVAGKGDRVFGPEFARDLAGGLPEATLHLLPETGHALVVERPAVAAMIVDSLFDRVQRERADSSRPRSV